MRFQVLGPVTACGPEGPVALGPARQRAVLAVLLVEPGLALSVEQLVDRVWAADPPQRARQTLHTYLSRLRGVLGDVGGPLLGRSGGYALEMDAAAVDLHRFRVLVAQARRAGDDARAAALWQEALGLWRGRPFAGLPCDWLEQVATGLEAERTAAVLDRFDVLLRRGEHARLLPELTAAAREQPLDERLAGQLILALYRCGRAADALAHFRSLQGQLAEELGSDPGSALRELHQRILRQDPRLFSPACRPAGEAGSASPAAVGITVAPQWPDGPARRPAQLPADVAGFTGRGGELRRLDELLAGEAPRAVVITAIGGSAGVGKTALAVHWAHRMADRFPDGQLYVNLRGYDPEQPVAPADALARFLTALGVTGQDIPLDVEERAARYRSELAGRRMLIVLDNAANVAQARPLLPGSGPSVVVVTSRDSLAGLVALHGAHRIDLDLLPLDEAVGLLRRLIGDRVVAEPEAATALAERCARLPLAVRVAAELAGSRPERTLADLVSELANRQSRLDLLDAGDPHAAVGEVLSWSIQHLPAEVARTFRLLGLHPGADLEPYAVAALTGTGPDRARRLLEVLARAHLVHRTGPGRYGMHDLLRAYAAQLATAEEAAPVRAAAEDRLFDYYQAGALSAMEALHPAEVHYRPKVVESTTATIPDLTEPQDARAWLEAERFSLVAIAVHADATDRPDYAVGLARILHRYLSESQLAEMVTINTHAQRAAERTGDPVGEAHALRQLGTAYTRLSQYETACAHNERALIRFREAGDRTGEALAMTNLGIVSYRLGDHNAAIDLHRRAMEVACGAGDRLSEAFILCNLAVVEERTGRWAEAADHNRQALALFRGLGSRYCEAAALGNLANVETRLGEYEAAVANLWHALELVRPFGGTMTEAHSYDALGMLYVRMGQPEPARECFHKALHHYRQTGERNGQAWAINGLGEAAQVARSPADALVHHTEALTIATDVGGRHQQARAHAGLGQALRDLGEPDRARTHYAQAYALYTQLDMPEAEEVRVCLAAVSGSTTGASAGRKETHPEP